MGVRAGWRAGRKVVQHGKRSWGRHQTGAGEKGGAGAEAADVHDAPERDQSWYAAELLRRDVEVQRA